MTLTDVLLLLVLLVLVAAWWVRRIPARRIVLIASAAAAIVIGVAGYLDDRWQDIGGAIVGAIFLIGLGGVVVKNRLTKTDRTGGVPWFSGVFIALGFAATLGTIMMFPVWPLPKPSGQHAVGVRTFEIDDAGRKGVFAAGPDEPRRLLVRTWYPAQSVSGDPAPYFTPAETASTARGIGSLIGFPQLFTYLRHAKTNSYTNAPLLQNAQDLPVVFYSHGYTSYLNQNTALMEELASHGYVVFSIQHTYDSSDTAFPDGTVAPIDPTLIEVVAEQADRPSQADAIGGDTLDKRIEATLAFQEYAVKNGDRIAIASTEVWVADRLFLHDTLQNNPPKEVAEIAQASNLDRVGEAGMSFGGAISGEICMIDPRCAAGVNMDGGNFPFSSFNANVPAPFLMFHSDTEYLYDELERPLAEGQTVRSFNEFSYEPIATAGTRTDIYRILLKRTRHLGLSDSSWFVGQPLAGPLFGDADAQTMIGAQNDFVRGFFDKHLKGEANDYPAKQLADYKDRAVMLSVADLPAWWNAKPEAERDILKARINAAKPEWAFPPPLELPPLPAPPPT
jgi:predicted dienelactone hydrolase